MNPLITAEELREQLTDVALFDIRWALTDPNHGRATYEAGHIPGAVFVDLDLDLADPPGIDGRHPLPPVEKWAETLGRLGVTPSDDVVVYDDMQGSVAARMWWMLMAIGHESVQTLDGGYQAWVGTGLPAETGNIEPIGSRYPVPSGFDGVAAIDDLGGRAVIDVRAGERYRGEVEPVDPKAGHIPGAINLPLDGSLGDDGRFLPAAALRERFATVGDSAIVHCGSGVNACHTALALVLAGRPMPDVYAGSFSEWSRRDRPVKTGSTP
jgi:thiosulfate/3-mercaptopyruvate sulfurtransferase